MDKGFEYMRVASAVPSLRVADPYYNVKEIIKICVKASDQGVRVLVFPELSMTGYTCQDLFQQKSLTDRCQEALKLLLEETKYLNMLIAAGMPVRADGQLFNCAVILKEGKILGLVPKTYLPNYGEFYEMRWFAPAYKRMSETITLCDQEVPFNEKLLFKDDKGTGVLSSLETLGTVLFVTHNATSPVCHVTLRYVPNVTMSHSFR
jgi:NAD+ synthase (glutamine-hydrolysing)